jgi:hypothetical protein
VIPSKWWESRKIIGANITNSSPEITVGTRTWLIHVTPGPPRAAPGRARRVSTRSAEA